MTTNLKALLLVVLLISGCSNIPNEPTTASFTARLPQYSPTLFASVEVIEPQTIFALTDAQQDDFLTYYHSPAYQSTPGHKRLFNYLTALTSGFTYKGKTYTASEAYAYKQGNCLSLAILTTALAQVAGLEISYQKMNSAPVYFKHDNIMSISSHVRTFVYDPDFSPPPRTIVIRKPHVVIDYFADTDDIKGNKVDAEDFVAMYYQNMAAEAIINQDFDLAHGYIKRGLNVSPFNPESLNVQAVLLMKKDQPEIAEKIYELLYHTGKGTVTTLNNHALIKERAGDIKGAKALIAEVSKIEDDNPYKWIEVARQQLEKQHYWIALKYYRKAIETAPYLAESYFGIANALYQSGQPEDALNYLRQARELAYIPEEEKRYSAKLYSLKAELQ